MLKHKFLTLIFLIIFQNYCFGSDFNYDKLTSNSLFYSQEKSFYSINKNHCNRFLENELFFVTDAESEFSYWRMLNENYKIECEKNYFKFPRY
mgnify:CR=1 FL=1